ncbi:hypothetical protein [Brevibacillus laterosporus]|uniref:hypothetical protein n=1 Tax=Brevibacillus laterosporus TaxID=1465 RepID=UPI000E6C033A|nr:hypothetical protein [Brevibacillus laterosporus]AYB37575.1 hypothetical protein D5F52_04375 [Brevibacillus laterosporus]MBM7111735.1 hypothetical protein [Brevibacillus laterosporus]
MLGNLAKDIVTLVKADGSMVENIKAHVQPKMIFIDDESLPIEEGDKLLRTLRNGLTEKYIVLDRGYYEGVPGIKSHYQVKVKKESALDLEKNVTTMNFNIGSIYGSTVGTQGNASIVNTFNFEAVDQMIEEHGGEAKEELRQMIDEIKELFEDSEKVKKGSLAQYSEKIERHSWIAGAIAQMALGFLSGQMFK